MALNHLGSKLKNVNDELEKITTGGSHCRNRSIFNIVTNMQRRSYGDKMGLTSVIEFMNVQQPAKDALAGNWQASPGWGAGSANGTPPPSKKEEKKRGIRKGGRGEGRVGKGYKEGGKREGKRMKG